MKEICTNGGIVVRGKYYLYNNLWGADTGSGSQCLWQSPSDESHIAWGTNWSWTGQSDTIKSYAAVVWGWHWGWKVANTGLPIQLTALQSLHTTWSFDLTHTKLSRANVTYDIWLSENPRPGGENPTAEVMVWLYKTGNIRPIGSKRTHVIVEGIGWDLWKGRHPVSDWPVCSFVRTTNTKVEALDLMSFFRHLVSIGLSSSIYLLGVEAGAEVFTGEGRLDTTLYSIDMESR
ncbi:MAG: endo-1,4-beta-glucanase [Anaerolineae bacterium]|jgi:xyloglucan-specific endo-beta-1,4-glucanase